MRRRDPGPRAGRLLQDGGGARAGARVVHRKTQETRSRAACPDKSGAGERETTPARL